jgi:alcohol dehydrogenase class IV
MNSLKEELVSETQPETVPAAPADDGEIIKRRSAQAMAATYVQMVRHAELARALHLARARATQRRLARTTDPEESARLARQLGAQERQGASIDSAVERFRRRMDNLSAFRDAGLTDEDFRALGLEDMLKAATAGAPQAPEPPQPDLAALEQLLGQAAAPAPADRDPSSSE